jgi:signal transduction histidine kinase
MVKVHDHDSKFSGSYFFIKDITERKYKESLDVKSELISMVAHELRTPLHAVREGISIMLDGLTGELNADQQEVLSTTKTSLDRLVRLVNAFLDFQRLEAGIMDFRLQPADLNGLVLDARKQAELLIKNKPLKIECRPQENLPAVLVDRDRIIQVLMNLLNNAIKFTEQGVITVTTETTDGGVKVSVRDTGIGIKPEDVPRLFRKFGQLEAGQIAAPGGTGLGLAICSKIIEQHKGHLWVESEYKQGSVFSFVIPLAT